MFDLTLSFDNGPEPDVTPAVLDTLARRGIRTTFFVIGEKISLHRALAERSHAEGHWIGNHTWTHSVPFGERTADATDAEVGRTQAAISDLAHPKKYFRPFGGGGHLDRRLFSRALIDHLVDNKFTCVLWNAIPRDWVDPDGWVDRAIAQCEAQPWTLMVLHDLPTGAMLHLDRFLALVQDRGGRLCQEFPPSCVPIVGGAIVRPIDAFTADVLHDI